MFALSFFAFATVLFMPILSVRADRFVWEVTADETAHFAYLPYQNWYENPAPERVVRNGPVEDPTLIDQCVDDTKDRVNGSEPAALSATIPAHLTLGLSWTDRFKVHKATKGGKIDHGKWAATDLLYKNKNVASATIPETLRPGEYYETVAFHQATSYPGVQVYGDDFPTGDLFVSVPGAYKPKTCEFVYGTYTNTVSSEYPTPVPRAHV